MLGVPENIVGWDAARFGGDAGQGESGDFGEELGDLVTRRNLEGDRESERRIDLTAEVTSTWWTCVGEGSVRVPPPLLGYGMVSFGMWRSSPMIPEMRKTEEPSS